jgi:protein-S-isoprenylcysteine O-methyltransferase Ste14
MKAKDTRNKTAAYKIAYNISLAVIILLLTFSFVFEQKIKHFGYSIIFGSVLLCVAFISFILGILKRKNENKKIT